MVRIFLYEHITAHGIGRDPGSSAHSLFIEGGAMLRAIGADFAAIPGVEVLTGSPAAFERLAATADWSFLIAPETDGILLRLARQVLEAGGRLLGPSPEAIALTSDKLALYHHWLREGVPTPETVAGPAWPSTFACVIKRRDGAGSEGMRILTGPEDDPPPGDHWIAQPLCKGIPASVAFLCGEDSISVPLPPAFQCLSRDGQFQYRGGLVPMDPSRASRAVQLATKSLSGISGLYGYVGVDLLLGEAADGSEDVAIEINPRLTTSYVGLRAHLAFNLAACILKGGATASDRSGFKTEGRVRFSPDGKAEMDPAWEAWWDPSEF